MGWELWDKVCKMSSQDLNNVKALFHFSDVIQASKWI